MSLYKIFLEPIGFVQTKAVGHEIRDKNIISKIVIREKYTEALKGIEEFSHLFVLFWLNEMSINNRKVMKIHPRGRVDMPLVGVFATRSPYRPNPIGLTRVKLLEIEGNVITVQGLDAYNNSPVLDLKPFDAWDTIEKFKVPEWWIKLEQERLNKKNS
jgi:tRNA-Thr(GGU) m(6)t(6)A37 methyltransferase TsaA